MNLLRKNVNTAVFSALSSLLIGSWSGAVIATEPCGDFGECKTLIEINSTDGDIGFHFLMDGDDLNSARIRDPNGTKVFEDTAKGPLTEQKLTETFAESAEPLCWPDPEADADEEIVTLEEFLSRWLPGTYSFHGSGDNGEKSEGETELTFDLPAAPVEVDFDGSVISWASGTHAGENADLGNCASHSDLHYLVDTGILTTHPESVAVDAYEVVLEPEVEDGNPLGTMKFSIRLPGNIAVKQVTVPTDYLASLPDDTPVKIEVGAIGGEDNATFTEADGFCVNEDEGCED